MKSPKLFAALVFYLFSMPLLVAQQAPSKSDPRSKTLEALQRDRLVAWCIVPFDSQKRNPAQRAEMLERLGIKKMAYDYRAEHIPSFDEEMIQLKKHNIELVAWWFPSQMNSEAQKILDVLERHQIKTQLWVTGSGNPVKNEAEQKERIESEVKRLRPIAEAAKKIGCQVALYNHGGWFGEPENQLAIIDALQMPNVGIVYNLHHAHHQVDRLAELLSKMKPHLMALNLNGTIRDGDKNDKKIVPLGGGELDSKILKTILDSGFSGPIGILNHTDNDAELRLLDNLDGLSWLLKNVEKGNADSTTVGPTYRTWKSQAKSGNTDQSKIEAEDQRVRELVNHLQDGEPSRGVVLFASAKSACLSCHKIGSLGGTVGPDLTKIGTLRTPEHLAQSLHAPNRLVEEKYHVIQVVLNDGEVVRGFRVREDAKETVVRDPARGTDSVLPKSDIERVVPAPSLMPEGLLGSMNPQQQADLLAFLVDLGQSKRFRPELIESVLEHSQAHDPATFPFERKPIDIASWPNWEAPVNRDRLYDFYAKEAAYFKGQPSPPNLLAEFPGLDTGKFGHWGNQNEESWANGDWNKTILGSIQTGVFHGFGLVVRRGMCLQLGDNGELSTCFNPETLTYDALWSGGFLEFSSVRHGFMNGLLPKGTALDKPKGSKPEKDFLFRGFYRLGKRIVFAYRIGDEEFLDSPWVENGQFVRTVAPIDQHPLKAALEGGPLQWPESIEMPIRMGSQSPYAIDTIELPHDNPWKALLFCGDHDFLPDGSALVCTMQGDVWHVSGLTSESNNGSVLSGGKATWRRFASGLHQALGLKVSEDGIFVLGRDQITRLHDLDHNGEADFYESYSTAYETSTAGHDFICGLQRDRDGNFYTASGNQGLLQISKDGKRATVLAEGFRNPDGLGIYPDKLVTLPCSEGNWTPSSMICGVRASSAPSASLPFYGYRGPKFTKLPIAKPVLPMVYLPRGLDNSSGGQVYIDSDRWGPLSGNMVHLSFGTGTHFLLLRDEVEGELQGAVVTLPGDFLSGVHRGRFSPKDGQLYVSGMGGWGTYTPRNGCFQRVRFAAAKAQLPTGIHFHENGVILRCSEPIPDSALSTKSHFAQAWNYRYSAAYGSKEYSMLHRGVRGHDRLEIKSCQRLEDGRTLFLEIPELQPCNQLHLQLALEQGRDTNLFATCNRLDKPFTGFAGYQKSEKPNLQHPIDMDVQIAAKRVPNPWEKKIDGARSIRLEAGKNLTFNTPIIKVKSGEPIKLSFVNPDVVPHNWALIKPGKLASVGEQANLLVSDPEAVIRHYVPQIDDVICFTDIVEPGEEFPIYFRAPKEKGRYPFLCTFPGHWMVMNGELIVE